MKINSIAVLGSGTMGRGIAVAAARIGTVTHLYDVAPHILELAISRIVALLDDSVDRGKMTREEKEATLNNIVLIRSLDRLSNVDMVIEAVPEGVDLKRKVFQDISGICRSDTIFASNTSSLSITVIQAGLDNSERVVGMHFFNPAHIMKLVEIVPGDRTAPDVVQAVAEFAEAMGKTPVRVKDTPAFIVNRVARPFYGEALRLLDENVADVPTVDSIVEGHGFRMGPFRLMDLIGIDVNFDVTKAVYEMFFHEPRYRPHHLQQKMVDAGYLGRKCGRGFYKYEKEKE